MNYSTKWIYTRMLSKKQYKGGEDLAKEVCGAMIRIVLRKLRAK